jgi:Ca2+-binding EF-hand superfamily protein
MKKFAIGLVVLGIVGLLAGGQALAKGGKNKGRDPAATAAEAFKALDKNGDGKLSLEEFTAGKIAEAEKSFKALDKDSKGFLSQDEFGPSVVKVKKHRNKEKKNV